MKLVLRLLATFVCVAFLPQGRCQEAATTSNGPVQDDNIDDGQLIAPLKLGWLKSHCFSTDGRLVSRESAIQFLPVDEFQDRIRSGSVESMCSTDHGSDNAHMYQLQADSLGYIWVYYPARSLLGVQPFRTRLYPTLTEAIKGEQKPLYTLDFQSALNISNAAAVQQISNFIADPKKYALQTASNVAALAKKEKDATERRVAEATDAAKKKEDDAKWAEHQAKWKEREVRSLEIYALQKEIEQLRQKMAHDTPTQLSTDGGLIQSKQAVIDAKNAQNRSPIGSAID